MANAVLTLNANRSPLSDLHATERDFEFVLSFDDVEPTSPLATLTFDNQPVCRTTRTNLYALASRAIGAPADQWPDIADSLGLSFHLPDGYTAVEQNVAKAAFLIALWLEPRIIAANPGTLADELNDELIIDYSGAVERQRYIYFPPQALDQAVADRLYRLHLLCRANLRLNEHEAI